MSVDKSTSLLHHAVKERELQQQVIQLAKLNNWSCYHTFDSRRSEPGFPDLVLVRDTVLFVELKTAKGRLSEAQKVWRDDLLEAGADWRLWRPSDWQEIEQTLARRTS